MTDYILPPDLVAAESEWRILDNTASYSSPLSGAVRTYARPGLRWGVRLTFRAYSDQQRRRVMATLSALRGRSNRLWLTDPGHVQAGSFSAPELLTNNIPVVNTTGWTSSDAELVISSDSHFGLRLARTGVTADRYIAQSAVATLSGGDYAIRAIYGEGKGNVRIAAKAGTTAGGTDLVNGTTRTAAGRYVESFLASGSTADISFHDFISGRAAGAFQFISWASVARCARVAGASQTGSSLNIDRLPASANGVFRAGDWVEINGELKRVTADVNSDGSGVGFMMFEPPLRVSPPDDSPIIYQAPMGKFLLADGDTAWATRPGIISDFTLDLVEDIA